MKKKNYIPDNLKLEFNQGLKDSEKEAFEINKILSKNQIGIYIRSITNEIDSLEKEFDYFIQ